MHIMYYIYTYITRYIYTNAIHYTHPNTLCSPCAHLSCGFPNERPRFREWTWTKDTQLRSANPSNSQRIIMKSSRWLVIDLITGQPHMEAS